MKRPISRSTPDQSASLRTVAHYSDGRITRCDLADHLSFQRRRVVAVGRFRGHDDSRTASRRNIGDGPLQESHLRRQCRHSSPTTGAQRACSPNCPGNNYIDDLIYAKLETQQIEPSPPVADATFLRRVYQDLIGRLPIGPTKHDASSIRTPTTSGEQLG